MSGAERETLLAVHWALTEEQFQSLKFLLEERVPPGVLHPATRPDLCRLLLQRFPGRALRLTARLLRQIDRHDLVRLYQLPDAEPEPAEPEPAEPEPAGQREKDAAGTGSSAAGTGSSAAGETAVARPGSASASSSSSPSGGAGRLTEKELLRVAQKLGKEWREVGIACLGLERSRLEQIGEEEPHSLVMRSFAALLDWQRRERGAATAARLQACLAPARLDPGVFDLLRQLQEG